MKIYPFNYLFKKNFKPTNVYQEENDELINHGMISYRDRLIWFFIKIVILFFILITLFIFLYPIYCEFSHEMPNSLIVPYFDYKKDKEIVKSLNIVCEKGYLYSITINNNKLQIYDQTRWPYHCSPKYLN